MRAHQLSSHTPGLMPTASGRGPARRASASRAAVRGAIAALVAIASLSVWSAPASASIQYDRQFSGTLLGGTLFVLPSRVAVDASGNDFVTDTGNTRIQEYDSAGSAVRKWGTVGTGNGQFLAGGPIGVATDSARKRLRGRHGKQSGSEVLPRRDLHRPVGRRGDRKQPVHGSAGHRHRLGPCLCRRHRQQPDPGVRHLRRLCQGVGKRGRGRRSVHPPNRGGRRLRRQRLRGRYREQPDREVRLLGQLHQGVGERGNGRRPVRPDRDSRSRPGGGLLRQRRGRRPHQQPGREVPAGRHLHHEVGDAGNGQRPVQRRPRASPISSSDSIHVVDRGAINGRVEVFHETDITDPDTSLDSGPSGVSNGTSASPSPPPSRSCWHPASSAASTPRTGRPAARPRPTRISLRAPTPSGFGPSTSPGTPTRARACAPGRSTGRPPRPRSTLARRAPPTTQPPRSASPRSSARASNAASTPTSPPTGRAAPRRSPTARSTTAPHLRGPGHRQGREPRRDPGESTTFTVDTNAPETPLDSGPSGTTNNAQP